MGTVTPDMMFPSTACLVQDKIGAKGAWGFDVSAGCSGFVFALQAGVKLVESGAHSKVLVCGADANTRMTDYTDRATCVLFGDGGGAVLIEPAEEGEIGMIDFVHEIDGSGGVSLNLPAGGSLNPSTPRDGGQEDALHPPGWAGGLQVCGAQDGRSYDEAAGAQWSDGRGSGMLSSRTRRTSALSLRRPTASGCPADRVIINIEKYGNTSAGTIPLAMETAIEEGQAEEGRLGVARGRGRGIHGWGGAAEVGDLRTIY